jgi:hypothetical protein
MATRAAQQGSRRFKPFLAGIQRSRLMVISLGLLLLVISGAWQFYSKRCANGAECLLLGDSGVWGVFTAVLGAVYAIVTGFILSGCLNRFGSLQQVIEDELNAAEAIRDLVDHFLPNATLGQPLKAALAAHLDGLQEETWGQQPLGDTGISTSNHPSYAALMNSTARLLESKLTASQRLAGRELLQAVLALARLRTHRIAVMGDGLSPLLKLYLVISGLCLWLATWFVWFGHLGLQTAVVTITGFSLGLLTVIILDLDEPSGGLWRIPSGSLQLVRESLHH